MPDPSVEPSPPERDDARRVVPLEAQDASYLAASERMASRSRRDLGMANVLHTFPWSRKPLPAVTEGQAVGIVPPSMTYSAPVMAPARSDTRKAMRSATSAGRAGRPSGMPPSDCMMILWPPS